MSEAAPAPQTPDSKAKPAAPAVDDREFQEVLKGLLGKVVTFVNAESFEEGGLGHKVEAGWYKGKLSGLSKDFMTVITEFKHGTGKKSEKEPVKQYLPISKVKRISVMKTQILVHI